MKKTLKVSVVVPAYNEEKSILPLLEKVNAQQINNVELEVVVVDDNSKDNTPSILKSRPDLYTHLVTMPTNQGKGAAVKAGLLVATGDYILFQDADLEYDPNDYGVLLYPVIEFNADVVIGSRMLAPKYTRVHYFWHKIGNRIITLIFNILNNMTFTDVYSCYLVYRKNLVSPEGLVATGWEQQAEILSKAIRASSIHYEVPIAYHGRTYAEGKKIKAHHAFSVIWMMIRQSFH